MDTAPFSPDYITARTRFRDAASRLGCQVESHPAGGTGPRGEELTIDVAIVPGARDDRTLVISGGIHGVEGPFGSAVQLDQLEGWIAAKTPPVRVVLVHALNPYGFAWRRRFNETNVDLNRNMLVKGEEFRGSPEGYPKLDSLLNPKRPPVRWEPVTLKLLLARIRYGMPALKESVAVGQHDYPRGLFYGGDGPSRMNEVLSAHFDRWIGESRRIVHLDFHTGLGAHAKCRLLIDYPLSAALRRRLSEWFGPDSFESLDEKETAYAARGSLMQWCMERFPDRDYLALVPEYGTYGPIAMAAGLRAENQAHHWGRPEDAATERAKARLAELFCPSSATWRTRVLDHSRRLIGQAIAGLAGDE